MQHFSSGMGHFGPCRRVFLDTEIGEVGFSAHGLQTGYSLLQEPDVTLAPFMVPRGSAQTDLVARLFANFRELAGILHRKKEEVLAKQCESVNQTRHIRQLERGEIVFRRMPMKARPAKHLLSEPSSGPYMVVGQSTFNSVKLKDPSSGQMVDVGVDVPMEQILAGPKRSQFRFDPDSEGRSIGQMVAGGVAGTPALVKASGWKPSKKKGWRTLTKGHYVAYQQTGTRYLSVAYVLRNDVQNQSVEAQSCRSIWTGTSIRHLEGVP